MKKQEGSKGENAYDLTKSSSSIALKREIGLPSGIAIICGIIIGSGIFVSPKGVVQEVGSAGLALLVWVFSGILSMIGALCYAELGTTIPKSGGDYEYIFESLGSLPAFLYLWGAIITVMPASNAVISLTFANNILQPFYSGCEVPGYLARIVAALCICLLTYVNCRNVKHVMRVQGFFTATKLLALVIIIVAGIYYLCLGHTANLENAFDRSKTDVGAIAKSFYSGLFSYAGWNYLNFLTEEIHEPYKNLPRALYISMPVVIIVYTLANVAYFVVLGVDQVNDSNAVAVLFADKIFGRVGAVIMPLLIACSTFGAVNGTLFSSSRLFFIGARHGHLPDLLALVNVNYFTPIPAIVCVGSLSVLMLVGDVIDLLNYAAFVEAASQTLCVGGLLWLRYSRPELERPIKVNIVLPILFLVIGVFLFFMPIPSDPLVFGIAILIILAGIPVYFCIVLYKRRPVKPVVKTIKFLTCLTQKLTFAAKEEHRSA